MLSSQFNEMEKKLKWNIIYGIIKSMLDHVICSPDMQTMLYKCIDFNLR